MSSKRSYEQARRELGSNARYNQICERAKEIDRHKIALKCEWPDAPKYIRCDDYDYEREEC